MNVPRAFLSCSALVLAISLGLIACAGTAPRIPQSGLPDPIGALQPAAVQQLFDGRAPAGPACRLAESHTRCTWTDTADSGRHLQVTFYLEAGRAEQVLARADAQPIDLPPSDRAAVVEGAGELEVWAVRGQRGLQLTYATGSTGDVAGQRDMLLGLAGQAATALDGGTP